MTCCVVHFVFFVHRVSLLVLVSIVTGALSILRVSNALTHKFMLTCQVVASTISIAEPRYVICRAILSGQ